MNWYEDEVKGLENKILTFNEGAETLFYGSSSIRMWTSLQEDFPAINAVNLGFGGSTLAACVWFFERIMQSFSPKRLIVYAGDNDIGDGRHPEEIFISFLQLVAAANKRFGNLPCYFISLKPSISRWHLADKIKYTNSLIKNEIEQHNPNWKFIDIYEETLDVDGRPNKEYFLEDGLHLSQKGYALWAKLVNNQLTADL
jgi:lysophospholipase L1-like esterase